jgi:hypothetical protein
MGEEGLLNMEVSSKHKQGRVQTKPFGRVTNTTHWCTWTKCQPGYDFNLQTRP